MANIYGIQKVPETEVRSGMDVAVGATGAAAQGAKAGQAIMPGPIGAVGGALVGGAIGYFGNKKQQAIEGLQQDQDQGHNRFVSSLEGRSAPNTNLVQAQARYGMKNRYAEDAEIEGDGSGDPINGIGEVHVDENYNIKNVAIGSPKHEQGGKDLPENGQSSLTGGDVIFPWQKDPAKFEKGMRMLKQYKFNGDKRAKDWLDTERDRLPTDEEYMSQGKYFDGGDFTGKKGNNKFSMQDAYNNPNLILGEQPTESESLASIASANKVDKNGQPIIVPDTNTGSQVVNGNKYTTDQTQPDYKFILDRGDGYQYRYDPATNHLSTRAEGETEWRTDEQSWGKKHKGKPGTKTNMQKAIDNLGLSQTPQQTNVESGVNMEVVEPTPVEAAETLDYLTDSDTDVTQDILPPNRYSAEEVVDETKRVMDEAKDKPAPEGQPTKEDTMTSITDRTNPLKYANILHNLSMGSGLAEKSERRFLQGEELDYKDRSAAQRRASLEQRNAQTGMMRGKGLSAGQQQSYMSQAGSRYLGQQEGINEREAQRADAVDKYNVDLRNRVAGGNVELANRYDMEDAQNRAAKQRYLDTAMSETSALAGIDEQARYMRDKDQRMMDIQEKSIPLLGTTDYKYTKENMYNPGWANQTVDTRKGSGTVFPEGSTVQRDGKTYKMINKNWVAQ